MNRTTEESMTKTQTEITSDQVGSTTKQQQKNLILVNTGDSRSKRTCSALLQNFREQSCQPANLSTGQRQVSKQLSFNSKHHTIIPNNLDDNRIERTGSKLLQKCQDPSHPVDPSTGHWKNSKQLRINLKQYIIQPHNIGDNRFERAGSTVLQKCQDSSHPVDPSTRHWKNSKQLRINLKHNNIQPHNNGDYRIERTGSTLLPNFQDPSHPVDSSTGLSEKLQTTSYQSETVYHTTIQYWR
jgi:hypothetical protein